MSEANGVNIEPRSFQVPDQDHVNGLYFGMIEHYQRENLWDGRGITAPVVHTSGAAALSEAMAS